MGALVDDFVAGAVDRAGARENEASDAARLGDFADEPGRRYIDIDRQIGIDGAGRIADKTAEVYDGIRLRSWRGSRLRYGGNLRE